MLPLGALHGVPSLPPHFLSRPDDLAGLNELLLADIHRPTVVESTGRTSALQGMGGVGKSVLAAAFAGACTTRRAFPDGIFWLTLGPHPDLIGLLRLIGQILGDRPEQYLTLESGQVSAGRTAGRQGVLAGARRLVGCAARRALRQCAAGGSAAC